jgi:hypothetical protein
MPALPSDAEVDAYIVQAATVRGINPQMAVNVSRKERASRSGGWVGDNGTSFGPFQLHIGGGLGDVFQQRTGLNVKDISTWRQQVDFALDSVRVYGWEPFHAAADIGIGKWDGIIRGISNGVMQGLKYFFPVVGYTGNPRQTYHTPGGADLFAPEGTDIRAVAEGRVSTASTSGPGGNSLMVQGTDGLTYYYAHMKDAALAKAGDFIAAGQKIGKVGKTGNAQNTAPHLHLGIGYGISTGTGADGGVGKSFDAQTFLASILNDAGSAESAEGVAAGLAQGAVTFDPIGAMFGAGSGTLKEVQQGLQNYVQNRAASIVLLIGGVLLILFAMWNMAMSVPMVKSATKVVVSRLGIPGAVAAQAI